ncbi:hypothetical protein BD310DRAFT_186769, partial [Dichomitus squalens]
VTAGNQLFSILEKAVRRGRNSSPSSPLLGNFLRRYSDYYRKNFPRLLAWRKQCLLQTLSDHREVVVLFTIMATLCIFYTSLDLSGHISPGEMP